MIARHQFPPAPGLPYRNRHMLELHKAPKGKLPWIDDDGTAFLASILMVPLETPIKPATAGHANLVACCRRMASRYFPANYSPR